MANIKSQKKRILTNAKATQRNKAVRAEMKQRMRTAREAAGTEEQEEKLRLAVKRIDSAVQKGVLHRNTGARKKSRLIKQVRHAAS